MLLLMLPFAIFRFRVQTLGFNGSMSAALLAGWLGCGLSPFFSGGPKSFLCCGKASYALFLPLPGT